MPEDDRSLDQALDALEEGLQSAVQAIAQIRKALAREARGGEAIASHAEPSAAPPAEGPFAQPKEAPLLRVVPKAEISEPPADETGAPPLRERDDDPYTPFERLWERMEAERGETRRREAEGKPELHGLELLPQLYMVTVEDRERRVDLVPLHRALLGIEGIDEITLASYANGVPVVSLRASHAIDMEQLRSAVESTLRRSCELIPQDNGRMFLRLTSQEKIGV